MCFYIVTVKCINIHSTVFAVIISDMMLHFSLSRHDEHAVSTSRSRTQNQKRHTSSSSRSSSTSPARHRHRRHSPVEATWVPAETSNSNLSHLVGSSKFSTSRSFDDSRVNPERKRNLSDGTAGEVFGPTLPPSEEPEKKSSESYSSNTENQETKSRQHRTSKHVENSVSASKKVNKKVNRTNERRHSGHKQKIARSRDTSSSSHSPRRSSRSQSSSSSTSSSPASKSKKKLSRTKSRSSVSASRSRRMRRSRSSSSGSGSGTNDRRKRVRRSTSSSSRSSSSRSRSELRNIKSTDTRSRKDQFEAHRRDRQGLRRDSYAGHERRKQMAKDRKSLPFSGRRKSRSNSRDRSKKHVPSHQTNWSSRKGESFDHKSRKSTDHKDPGPTAKLDAAKDVHPEERGKRLADYSSSEGDERTKTGQNKSGVARKVPTADRNITDSKKPTSGQTSGRRSDTAGAVVADTGKGADSDKRKTDDKPKETLEDMELFLKQLKANKQQMLKK